MRFILRPAVWLMSRVPFPGKLALVGVLFLIPLILLLGLLIPRLNDQIAVSGQELAGIRAIRPITILTSRVQAHRGMAQLALSGDAAAPGKLKEFEDQAEESIRKLDEFDRRYGERLDISSQLREIKARWRHIQEQVRTLPEDQSFLLHTEFIHYLNDSLMAVADASGLTLETELVPYYVAQIVVANLPELSENLGQARALSSRAVQRKALTAEERYHLSTLIGKIEDSRNKLLVQMEKALTAAPGLKNRLQQPLRDVTGAALAFAAEVQNEVLLSGTIKAEGQALFDTGTLAIDADYRMCNLTLPTLEGLIQGRLDRLTAEKRLILIVTGLALALAAYLFMGFTNGILKNLAALKDAAGRFASGDFHAYAILDSRDELKAIATSFNGMADSLRAMVKQLRDSEEKHRRLMEQASDVILVGDLRGRLLDANLMAEKLLGYSREELLAMNVLELSPEPERERAATSLARLVQEGSCEEERLALCKNGLVIPMHAKCTLIEFDWGRLTLGIFRDISERKCMENQLRLNATVFEHTAESILITDAERTIITVNPAFTKLTGYLPEEVVGKTPAILKSGRHTKDFYRRMWDSLNEKGEWQGEIWDRRKDGKLFPAWLTLSAARDETGRTIHYVGIFSDISAIKESQSRIEFMATHDTLTGLPNRSLLYDHIHQAIAHASRQQEPFALMFIDLDNFKAVNDAFGHDLGDHLLQEAARRINGCMRAEDTLARLGGDEFTALISSADRESAAATAQRIVEALAPPFSLNGNEVSVTASIGISLHPADGTDRHALMKCADAAMYRAKGMGKNTFRFFNLTI